MKNPLAFWLCVVLLLAAIIRLQVVRVRNERVTTAIAAHPGQPGFPAGLAAGSQPIPTETSQMATAMSPTNGLVRNAAPRSETVPVNSRRAWDYNFFGSLSNAVNGGAIEFELTGGERATGRIRHLEHSGGQLILVAGDVSEPEAGSFSFRKQTLPGKAGDYSGEVIFPGSQRAFRIEPTGPDGKSELVARRLDEVICLLPPPSAAVLAAEAEEIPPLNPSDVPDYVPPYNDGIISLQSLPGATGVLYMDYRGGYTPTWGGITYDKPNVSNAQIKDVWKRVAEDYMPFNINVTTDIRVYEAAPENSRQRCVLTPTTTAAPGAGGVAYVGDWNNTGDRPCWSFYYTGKSAAEVVSHEVGHTLGLSHDGRTAPYNEGYYAGQGSGSVGWAPIMGVGYYQPVAQWSKGEYAYANQTQDDLSIIVNNNNNVDYRADDTGATLANARYLEVYSNFTVSAEGVIETTGDTDAFRFTTTGGAVTLTANPAPGEWADLAIMATLADATDTVIASNNPQTVLSAGISTNLPAGTYTFRVTGASRNDPLTNGFSAYASLGYYSVTGSVAYASIPSRFSLAENSANGTVAGIITATNHGVDPLGYGIVSGNTSNTFSVDYNGVLTVANSNALNYEAIAAKSSFPAQYELFVNITNLANPTLTELGRRVVVGVLDVNEAPSLAGFTNSLIAHTQPGTLVGTIAATDPDFYSVLALSIISGNSNNAFALDSGTGKLTVAGDLNPSVQAVYTLGVRVSDNGSPALSGTNYVQINVVTNFSPFLPGSLSYSVYDGIGSGTSVANLTNNAKYPRDPNWEQQRAAFEGDTDRADNYGSVMRGYLIPPTNGNYTFFIATDDDGELWLSATTNPATATRIAYISGGWASPREWTKFPSQKSATQALLAGQAYYIEARQKEGGGGDNLAVGWAGPANPGQTNVISGFYLAPYFMNYVPHASGFTNTVRRDAVQNAAVGRLTVTDVNANDAFSFTLLSGNTGGVFAVDSNGWVRVASELALQSSVPTNFTLSIRVTDNGVPSLSATTSVSLTIVASDAIAVTAVQREMFYNIGSGGTVASLTNSATYPRRPDALVALSTFASPVDVADNYGSRIRALVVPSVPGDYKFFIASDDNSQLKFSRDTNAANAVVIASVASGAGWTSANEWTKLPEQGSALITNLVAGQRYYIEALQKEGGGGDHVEVGWLVPGSGVTNVIPAANLQPVDLNYPPQFSGSPAPVIFVTATNGQVVTTAAAMDSPLDTLTYKIVSGNTDNAFAIDYSSGVITVANNAAFAAGAPMSIPLVVAAQDSGYGGLYPLKSAQTTVTVNVINPGSMIWNGGGTANFWSQAANWGGTLLTNGARVYLGSPVRQVNTNDAVSQLDWLQFTVGGFSVAGNPIVLQSGLTNNGNNTWGIPTTLGGPQTWQNVSGTLNVSANITNAGNALTIAGNTPVAISGVVVGAGSLNKSGTNTLTLSGANIYAGGTVINDGTLQIGTGAANGTIGSGYYTNNGGARLYLNYATAIAAGTGLWSSKISGAGKLELNSAQAVNGSANWGPNSSAATPFSAGFTGVLQLDKGRLDASPAGLGGISKMIINDGAQFLAWSGTYAVPIEIAGDGWGESGYPGALRLAGNGTATWNGGITLVADAGICSQGSSTFTLGGSISGNYQLEFEAASGQTGTNVVMPAAAVQNSYGTTKITTGAIVVGGNPYAFSTGPLLMNGGTLKVSGFNYSFASLSGSGTIGNYHASSPSVVTVGSSNASTTFSGALVDGGAGTLGLTKVGSGTLTLSAANTCSGPITVGAGTLLVSGSTGIGAIAVQTSAFLGGTGTLGGAVSVQSGGTLAPGTGGVGKLTANGAVTLGGVALMEISATGGLTNDLLATTAALNYGGILTVTNLGGASLVLSNSFKLFSAATYDGNFTTSNLPPLGTGLAWNWNPTNGTLRVVNSINPNPPKLAFTVSGGTLTLSWPNNLGWKLQFQTNSLAAGLGGNWITIPGSEMITSTNIPIVPSKPTVFYRLILP